MSKFALNTALPRYLRVEQERIEKIARDYGLDFFPVIFEMLTYDQMNEIAAYGGFPSRYPHWRFGMEYEQLSKSYEYGLSKIYEMVINNNPSYAYLLEGNSLTDQKLVMAHVFAHVDFFKNNFCFRATDLDARGAFTDPVRRPDPYDPDRRWIDQMANHGARISRHIERYGINKIEAFLDHCLSLENLIDPFAPFTGKRLPREDQRFEDDNPLEVPKLAAKDYMDAYINPEEYLDAQRKKMEAKRPERKTPERPERDVLKFLLDHAPLERWERDVLEVVRAEAYYFVPQEADQDHERGLGLVLALEDDDREGARCLGDHRLRRQQRRRHGHLAGALQPLQGRRRALSLHRGSLEQGPLRPRVGGVHRPRRQAQLGHAHRPRQEEDLPGPRPLQRRDLHRRVPHPRVHHRPEDVLLRLLRVATTASRSRAASSRR